MVKAKQVLLLLQVLETALEIEREIHVSVFQRLRSEGLIPPNVNTIRSKVAQELNAISQAHQGFLDVNRWERYAEGKRKEIHNTLHEMYTLK